MKLFRWFLSRLPRFDVGDGRGDTFFSRYDLLKTRWFAVYLHEFYRSDNDRCLHDHPWPFLTIILRGGYWEQLPERWSDYDPQPLDDGLGTLGFQPKGIVREWRRPGYVGRYPAEHTHRIELDPAKPKPWSLVIVGRRSRSWGFWGPDGWIKWEKGKPNPICER
jgi:hypothetical protein